MLRPATLLLLSAVLAAPSFAKVAPKPAAAKAPKADPSMPHSDDPLEAKLIAGEYQKKGFYRADNKGFTDRDLQTLLVKYAKLNKVDWAAQHTQSGSTKAGSGDLEQGVTAGLPEWVSVFQKAAASSPTWGVKQAVESKLMGAYYYRFFRKLYAAHNAKSEEKWAMPVSVEYFIQHLGKSLSAKQQKTHSGNGMANWETIGGGGPNYCAAASGQAMKHGFANYGLKMGPIGYAREHGFKMLKATAPGMKGEFDLRPGDVCSIRSLTGPESGHVITVAYPIDMEKMNHGTMWVTSGNAMLGSIAVDFLTVERAKGKRPSQGKIMILNCTTDSDVHFAHWKGEDLSKFKLTKLAGDQQSPPDFPSAQTEHPR